MHVIILFKKLAEPEQVRYTLGGGREGGEAVTNYSAIIHDECLVVVGRREGKKKQGSQLDGRAKQFNFGFKYYKVIQKSGPGALLVAKKTLEDVLLHFLLLISTGKY
jgi:hypothetical protein